MSFSLRYMQFDANAKNFVDTVKVSVSPMRVCQREDFLKYGQEKNYDKLKRFGWEQNNLCPDFKDDMVLQGSIQTNNKMIYIDIAECQQNCETDDTKIQEYFNQFYVNLEIFQPKLDFTKYDEKPVRYVLENVVIVQPKISSFNYNKVKM